MVLVVRLSFALTLEVVLLPLFQHSLALAVKMVGFRVLFPDYFLISRRGSGNMNIFIRNPDRF